jgi:hypothetical protein
MDPSEKFVKFAVECERMAKFTHTPEDISLWKQMAQRWIRCAELYDGETSAAHYAHLAKRRRTPARGRVHEKI